MIIKQLILNNFRQFRGEQTVTFSQDTEQNITLILGDNTSGKTTLLQAFLWAFYGTANFKTKDSLINAHVAQEILLNNRSKEMSVSIELEHEGIEYYLVRSQNYNVKNNNVVGSTITQTTLKFKEKSQIKNLPNHKVQSKLEEILPKDLSSYFLYDTERFGNITSRADVTKSVKGILGLTVLDNIIKHLGTTTRSGTVLNQFSINLNTKGDEDALKAYENIQKAEESKLNAEASLNQKNSEVERYRQIIREKEAVLKDLEQTAKLQKEKEEKNKQLEFENSELIEAQKQFKNAFKSNSLSFLGQSLFFKALTELKTAKLDKKHIRDMNANAIKDIIERGTCVCGTEICEGNEAHNNLLEEIRYLPPESIGTLVNNFKQAADMHIKSGENYYSLLENQYKYIVGHKDKIGELKEEIQAINDQLSGEESVAKHHEDLMHAEEKLQNLLKEIGALDERINVFTDIIRENQTLYEKSHKSSTKNKELITYMEYAKNILEWVTNRRDMREGEIKKHLEERVNFYFKKMYHGNRKVSIDEKFRVNLITTDLSEELHTDESQGLETVKNFAFISGLVDLAKQKLNDEYEKDAEAYPLILDAPFSNADDKHVKNISEVLPNVANQLILIVMAKDWNYAKEALRDKVGQEYFLSKQSEIYTKITGVGVNV